MLMCVRVMAPLRSPTASIWSVVINGGASTGSGYCEKTKYATSFKEGYLKNKVRFNKFILEENGNN